jgi:hypothetical protein
MMKRIRTELMNDEDDGPLSGDAEVDETSVRGRYRGPARNHSEAESGASASRSWSGWSSAAAGSGCGSSPRAVGLP